MSDDEYKPVISESEVRSLEEWLKSWGEGPNWMDPTGIAVPVTKAALVNLIKDRDEWKRRAEATDVLLKTAMSTGASDE